MPSDERMRAVLAALSGPRDRYRSALAATLEEVRVFLDAHQSASDGRLAHLAAELGAVGADLIHIDRLAAVTLAEPAVQPAVQAVMTRALAVLQDLVKRGDEAFGLELVPGENLYQAAADLLAQFGRAMGAARVIELARSGRYRPAEHDRYLQAFPFGLWGQAERLLAPPVVIELDGADLRPAGLAEFLDGSQKIVLVVRGETTPAPLVRLITPRSFVAQAGDTAVLPRFAAWEGPGIVGLMPPSAARFVHDPSAGAGLGSRLTVSEVPTAEVKRRAGPFTTGQQREELDQLKALQAAAASAPAAPLVAGADPVDKLAAWLLQQADLSGV